MAGRVRLVDEAHALVRAIGKVWLAKGSKEGANSQWTREGLVWLAAS